MRTEGRCRGAGSPGLAPVPEGGRLCVTWLRTHRLTAPPGGRAPATATTEESPGLANPWGRFRAETLRQGEWRGDSRTRQNRGAEREARGALRGRASQPRGNAQAPQGGGAQANRPARELVACPAASRPEPEREDKGTRIQETRPPHFTKGKAARSSKTRPGGKERPQTEPALPTASSFPALWGLRPAAQAPADTSPEETGADGRRHRGSRASRGIGRHALGWPRGGSRARCRRGGGDGNRSSHRAPRWWNVNWSGSAVPKLNTVRPSHPSAATPQPMPGSWPRQT